MRTNTSNLHLQPDLRKGKSAGRGRGTEPSTAASQVSLVFIDQNFGLTLLQPGTGHILHSGRSSDQVLQGIPQGRGGIRQGIPQEIR